MCLLSCKIAITYNIQPLTAQIGMASPATEEAIKNEAIDAESDYGSEFSPEEVEIVEALLSPPAEVVAIEDNPIVNDIEYYDAQRTLRMPRVLGRQHISPLYQAIKDAEKVAEQINAAVEMRKHYPDLSSQIIESLPTIAEPVVSPLNIADAGPTEPPAPDTRSPLERFRTPPKKPLSVTDLVSPAWCELQYWYSLTKHGRKRRTSAMKQGSAVHKVLEEQVHKTVQIDIQTKEDAWGLRIWNVIQGLRTLRETGQTRELEVWGTIDGLVVNGVIDELNYICPDVELEDSYRKKDKKAQPASDQTTLAEFFKASDGTSSKEAARRRKRTQSNKVYVCDVKTRSVKSLPNNASFRPTQVQLMLYHHLLSSLATNTVDFSVVATRYNLDTAKIFSDSFIAQVGSLNDCEGRFYDAVSDVEDANTPFSSQDSTSVLLAHNNLASLWSLMISEFRLTLPDGVESLGKVLKAEYRSRDSGEVVGSKTLLMDEDGLKVYLDDEIQWWRGERETKGVAVEDAFKCRSCEFAEGCEWRLQKIGELTEKARLKKGRKTSVV
ncbi:exonuclease V protein [Rutstroemia sp. NJR-2017a BVV2]|nr:exonuclease V protein [Rutstroemia sp. NJR-2017a BVV2]